jgi:serine/threonine protein kinase
MIPPRDILDYLVAELRVGARAPADVLSHIRHAWIWDEGAASRLQADIREAHDGGRLTDAEAGDLSLGMEAWLTSMADDDPTESLGDPAIIAMQLTRESHDGPSLELRPGVVLHDRYVLGEAIARGGQSILFRAHVLQDDGSVDATRPIAIKVLKDANPPAAAIARLKREFRQTALLRHPGVADMFDFGCDRGTWFIAMELLEGMSLRTRLNRVATQPLGRSEALEIIAACGAVLDRAHRQGFAHGDVKPGNLFLHENGGVKVLDFGTAHDVHPAPPALTLEEAGAVSAAVTRTYASPELLEGLAVDPRDDVFSLACVAYEMLAGRHPFSRVPADEARGRAMEAMPVVGLTPRQNAALASGLAWSRRRRPSSMQTWLDALLDERPTVQAKSARTTGSLAPAEWLPWRWIGAVAAAATLLFAVIWWTSRSTDQRTIVTKNEPIPLPQESPVRDAPSAVASQSLNDAAGPLASTGPAFPVPLAQSTNETMNAKSPEPGDVARPARALTPDRVRIEAGTRSIRISEGAPVAAVVLRRSGNPRVPVTVTWQLQDGSALDGEDFSTPAERSARFASGQTTRAIYVPLVNDDQPEAEEHFSLTLKSRAAAIDDASPVTITILDDD